MRAEEEKDGDSDQGTVSFPSGPEHVSGPLPIGTVEKIESFQKDVDKNRGDKENSDNPSLVQFPFLIIAGDSSNQENQENDRSKQSRETSPRRPHCPKNAFSIAERNPEPIRAGSLN